MDQARECELIVVGGGIAGVSAALGLAKAGFKVHVLEKAPQLGEIGAGIQIAPNAMRALDELGALDAVKRAAVYPKTLTLMDIYNANQLKVVDLGSKFIDQFGYPYIVLHRSDLLDALIEVAKTRENISFETDREVVSIKDEGEHVYLVCKSGSKYRAKGVIGADGLWSNIRKLSFVDDPVRTLDYVAYRGTIPMQDVKTYARADDLLIWVGDGIHLVQYPVRGGELYNQVAVFRSEKFDPLNPDKEDWGTVEELDEKFSKTCAFVQRSAKGVGRTRRWPLRDRDPIVFWARNRVVLTGDAAHPMLQYLAQGACQALEDAVCMSHCVTIDSTDLPRAFNRFQNRRVVRANRVQMTARFFEHFWHPGGAGKELRDNYLATVAPDNYDDFDWLYGSKTFS